MRRKSCVYKHIVNGKLIYIGKGNESRPYTSTCRNKTWERLAKDGFDVEIVQWFDNPKDALREEKALIKKYNPPANISLKVYQKRIPFREKNGKTIALRLPHEMANKIQACADDWHLPLSWICRRIFDDWMEHCKDDFYSYMNENFRFNSKPIALS